MSKTILFSLIITLQSACIAKNSDWIPLFDGETTKGWNPRATVESFKAVNNELHLVSKTNVWVVSDLKLKDFEAECEVRIPLDYQGFNSGLGFRLSAGTGKPKGYQCEIDQSKPAGIYGIGMGGWLYPTKATQLEYNTRVKGIFSIDEWNHFRVVCKSNKAKTFLNNTLIAEVSNLKSFSGHFGIQHHGKGGTVRFRNLRTRAVDY